jgi:GT2 family glycosyltransferase
VHAGTSGLKTTVIIPFHQDLRQLCRSLPAVRLSMPDAEILVASDAAVDDCRQLAADYRARVIELPQRSGPAAARNRAAEAASGDILVFVDADVVVAHGAIPGMCRLLASDDRIAAVFGAYDESPAESNFMSQYRNLSHSYVHQTGRRDAETFWAGLGAVRASLFRDVGGFDESFRRPSVEDIELGYRIRRAGGQIRLAPEFRGCHLKRWTVWGSIVTDIRARGIPWAQLIRKFQSLRNDLNTRVELRLSVLLAYLFLVSLAAAILTPWATLIALGAIVGIALLNLSYYRWFARRRDWWFAARVFPAHVLHHICNGISFVIGTALFMARRAGLTIPGAISPAMWQPAAVSASKIASKLDYV